MAEVSLISIAPDELLPAIISAFIGDDELLDEYQPEKWESTESLAEYVKKEILSVPDTHLYKINDGQTDIGYCALTIEGYRPYMLLSFGVNMIYRKKEVLLSWLDQVEKKLGQPYYTCLWNENTRAIDFFKKNGFEAVQRTDIPFTYMVKGDSSAIKDHVLCQ